jgi:F420H(2)-dependent biliverdin reductase
MALDPADLPEAARAFLRERHLATLTTLRADSSPHVVPVGFTWDDDAGLARVICGAGSVKARNARRASPTAPGGGRASLCQVDGRRWITLEGTLTLRDDARVVEDAVRRYAERYRPPRPNPERVVLELAVDAVLGWPGWTPPEG